jgi:hypothetical protein
MYVHWMNALLATGAEEEEENGSPTILYGNRAANWQNWYDAMNANNEW